MERLIVTARMKTPLILGGGFLTLDALLASLIFDQTGDVELSHGTVPLLCEDGLFSASAALLEPMESRKVSFVANLRAVHTLDPDLLLKNKFGGVHRKVGLSRRREFGAVMNSYTSFDAPEVTWYATGDGEKVQQLLTGVGFIGKRRSSGYGEVKSWSVVSGDLDGITGPFGEPLRPVPESMFRGDRNALKLDAAWRPAYWNPQNRAICYAPELVS